MMKKITPMVNLGHLLSATMLLRHNHTSSMHHQCALTHGPLFKSLNVFGSLRSLLLSQVVLNTQVSSGHLTGTLFMLHVQAVHVSNLSRC